MVIQICETCEKEFNICPAKIKAGKGKYCSKDCYEKARSHPMVGVCLTCGNEFVRHTGNTNKGYGKFCSFQCYHDSDIYANRKTRLKNYMFTCIQCGKEFERTGHDKHRNRFCTHECSEKYHMGLNHPNWNNGSSFEPYCPKFNKTFKERVRSFFDYKCIVCGDEQNGRRLHVHHVAYTKDSCCNTESPKLFAPLCGSCHSRTNHNRKKWEHDLTCMITEKYHGRSYFTTEEWETIKSPQSHILPCRVGSHFTSR